MPDSKQEVKTSVSYVYKLQTAVITDIERDRPRDFWVAKLQITAETFFLKDIRLDTCQRQIIWSYL